MIDTNLGGIESSSVIVITGPSNHCKSILMVNLAQRVILNNPESFQENDTLLYITLEDDAYKLIRRFASIFGNIDANLVKNLFIKISALFKSQKSTDINKNSSLCSDVCKILTELINESIVKITNRRCKIIIKHSNENSYSVNDVTKFIDTLRLEGYNIKALFLDYIDTMIASSGRYVDSGNDYQLHGQIVQELRLASRNYTMPIVTITQNSKSSENTMNVLGNDQMGDSYRKVRYADYIIMVRLRSDMDLLSPALKQHVLPDPTGQNDQQSTSLLSFSDLGGEFTKDLVPFEMKITKAKDGKRDDVKFHIFSGLNLRIYDSANEYFSDIPEYKSRSKWLQAQVDILGINSSQMVLPTNDSFDLTLL